LEFNVPFQHKYGYIRDDMSLRDWNNAPPGHCILYPLQQGNCWLGRPADDMLKSTGHKH